MSVVTWRPSHREGLPVSPCTVAEETQGTESEGFVGAEDRILPVKIGTKKI